MRYEYIPNLGETITIPVPECYSDCLDLVKTDYKRYKEGNVSILKILLFSLVDYNFRYCFLLRFSRYKGFLFPYFRWRLGRLGRQLGISFSRNVRLGYSFKIVHAIGIVVNATAVIGSNCTMHQFTTIGSDKDNAAVIGNDVYIGPNVCLVENVHIGNSTKIGAGAVVVNNIPSGVTAVGVPAKAR